MNALIDHHPVLVYGIISTLAVIGVGFAAAAVAIEHRRSRASERFAAKFIRPAELRVERKRRSY